MKDVSFYSEYNLDWDNHFIGVKCKSDSEKTFYDSDIAYLLHLEANDYQEILVNRFNGYYDEERNNEVFFANYRDAERALDWINSIYLSRVLSKGI